MSNQEFPGFNLQVLLLIDAFIKQLDVPKIK